MTRRDHAAGDREEGPLLACPVCGLGMVLRRPKPGGKRFAPFYGCSGFPLCTATVSEYHAGAIVHGDYDEDELR